MAQKISEETEVRLDLKTIGMIVGFTISLSSMYFVLKAEIAQAMSNDSKHYEFNQDISDVAGTDRKSKSREAQQKQTQNAISHINIEKAKNKN